MADPFQLADALGPAKILHLHLPRAGLKAVVVVDNVAAGPAIGGVRMAPDADLEECFRLARAMTLKNAAAGLPHGGAKSVIIADSRMAPAEKEALIRAFGGAIRDLRQYVPGPDMGTDERAMAWMQDEGAQVTGLPRTLGGIPLDEIGATGLGVAVAAEVAQEHGGPKLAGARVAVQGFGAVGRHAARFLAEKGAVLVAASDSTGTISDKSGLNVEKLAALKADGRSVTDYVGGEQSGRDDIIAAECDIWIPAARPDVLTEKTVSRLRARLVVQGANIPATPAAEATLHRNGIISIPDFIANAGGVICAAVEYRGGSEARAMALIEERIRANTAAVLSAAEREGVEPREAATALARKRVEEAMGLRRWA